MHREAMGWLHAQSLEIGPVRRVLEVGSRNVNGSARQLWPGTEWLGTDLAAGPAVDLVVDASSPSFLAEVANRAGMLLARCPTGGLGPGFDLVVCCETLEHACDPAAIVRHAARALRPGGAFLMTCAGDGRQPHSAVDGGPLVPGEYYANVQRDQFERWALDAGFAGWRTEHHPERGDLYAVATTTSRGENE